MIVHAFEKNIFPLSKEKIPQHEEWALEEHGEEYIPPKERTEIIAEKEKGINNLLVKVAWNIKVRAICLNDAKTQKKNK